MLHPANNKPGLNPYSSRNEGFVHAIASWVALSRKKSSHKGKEPRERKLKGFFVVLSVQGIVETA